MTDARWKQFFELLTEIIDLEMPVGEKAALAVNKAKENNSEQELSEFTSWSFYYKESD